MNHRRTAMAASVTLVVGTIAAIAILGGASHNIAFAQVIDNVGRTKSVQYTETRTNTSSGGEKTGPTEVTKIYILGRSLERKEILSATAGDPLPDGATWTQAPVGIVGISDLANGKIVTLDPNCKTFHKVKSILSISLDDGKVSESNVQAAPQVDFYARIRDLPIEEAEQLPEEKMGDKKVVGFRTNETVERSGGVDTWTRTYWVDVESNLPVQVETTFQSTNPRMGGSRWVYSDIVFDAPLDASLFSTDPPEGFEVLE